MSGNPYEVANHHDSLWESHEAGRLRNMDEFLGAVTVADLVPVLEMVDGSSSPGQQLKVLDVGAGTGTTVEQLVQSANAQYFPFDVNRDFLLHRATPHNGAKIIGKSEELPIHNDAFDITYSRAVTAWSADPSQAIAEQLRVTREGGVAVFTEFDWGYSRINDDSGALEACKEAKAIMLLTLTMAGFKPEYGAGLGNAIDDVIAAKNIKNAQYGRQEVRHELPEGDYRQILLETCENILQQLKQVGRGQAAVMASFLEGCIVKIRAADSCIFTLPALCTQMITLGDAGKSNDMPPSVKFPVSS